MAAEIPVKDVLCEAMEYLSKLGSNLRTRSENLKEKKINKVKLTNALAVQKAADKVLLICQLSKKSLANVEAGVRKVLEQIDVSQATSSVGGKSSSSKDERKRVDEPKYHYFDYKSRKLKIKNKISLKHYKSVKVCARKMTLTMLEKYPVYHDCALYSRRRKKEKSMAVISDTSDVDEGVQDKLEKVSKKIKNDGYDSDICSNSACDNDERHDGSDSEKMSENIRSSEKSERRHSKQSDENNYPDKKFYNMNEHEESDKTNKRKKAIVDSSEESNNEKKNDRASSAEPDVKKRKMNRNENNKDDDVISLNSDDETLDNQLSTKKTEEDTVNNSNNDAESNTAKPIIKCVSISKLLKPDIFVKNTNEPLVAKDPKNASRKRVEFDVGKKNEMLQERMLRKKDREEEFWATKRKEVSAFKPKDFCIKIIRLPKLSTEFLHKNNLRIITREGDTVCDLPEENNDSTVDESKMSSKIISKQEREQKLGSPAGIDTDDEQLIAEANKVKNSLLNESDSDISTISKNDEKESETTVDRVKNALLHSDSDQNDDIATDLPSQTNKEGSEVIKKAQRHNRSPSEESNKSKDSISAQTKNYDKQESAVEQSKSVSDNESNALNNSDSDNQSEKSDKSCNKVSETDKKNSENDDLSDSQRPQKTLGKESSPAKEDNAKKSLLDDSSDDKMEIPLKQRKESTPRSKKKRIRESAQAKNELLRYSSGSETEDGKLKVALDNVKKSLLEGMSDDENKSKAHNLTEQRRSSKDSSSSEEDIIKTKKKKSHSDSTSSSSKKRYKKKKHHRISDSEDSKKNESSDEDKSTSSSRKMVRSKAKPGNCSSHSSDAQDPNDKDIDGLTNLGTLKQRRRNSDATDATQSSNSTAKSRMAKQTGLISEEILKAESSSDEGSDGEVEALDDDEDLPSVSLSGFNGTMDHLVKEDLLGESDSSVSIKGDKKEDSDEEEKLNAKRRKAANALSSDSETGVALKKTQRKGHAISSDSETGPVRKKDDDDVKLSDFEDSDDSAMTKRTKRRKKGSDSDGSVNSDGGKKKRRRIKSLDESDGSGSDSETDGRKHGRKNIRKVMGKNQLEEATKRAARQEKERVARIAERQKMYNNLQFDESGKPDEVVLDKVILDFDPETKEPIIAVDRGLVKKLKPHQANGIKFMWDACFESVKRIKKDKGSGCILAHCMGLGKTLQVVALTHTLLAHDALTKVHRVLVVCPLSTVLNWVNEFKMWLKYAEGESDIEVYELSRFKQNGERAFQLSQWYEHGGVCVLGYEMFRNLSADNNKKFKKKMLKNFQESLVDPGPDLVVCDEGHLLKNEKTSLSQSMNRVRTLRRIVLTGTPLQNNLKEYYCMVQFVKPNLLGKYNEYLNRFVNPITNGQYTDSTDHDIRIMKRRSHVLHKMLDGAVQRRDYGVLAPFLPPKHEYVLFITLSDVQVKLYQHYLENYSRRPQPGKSSGFLFPDFQSLQRIWTHPLVLKYNSERYEIQQQKKRDKEEEDDSEGSLADFIDDDSTPDESSAEESFDNSSDCSDDSRKKSKKKKANKKSKGKDKDKESSVASRRRATRANPVELDEDEVKMDEDIMEVKYENPTEWWIKMVEEEELEDMRNSHKLVLLFDILRQCEAIGDKLLVFSQSLYSLDLIEHFLGKVDEATQDGRIDEKLGGHVGSWSPGLDYFRLDGSTSCENRSIWCKSFNREDNQRARLFLISTRAGGLGINLVAANRVVIFDVSWNPSHDVQSIFRVYRFGQKKPCYVYRFLAMGTMEEKIYERQVTKQAISKRVIDEQQIDRHYAENDLAELYKFEPQPPSPRPLPPLPKDRLFAEMLREHEAQIYKYHEHDSLLENKEEETLSEEERKAAWEDFENEKNRPPPAPFVSPWPMHNGMVPNLMVQQQQQLAYAALASMLRKDMPAINDSQIRDMLPMIYNANPAMFGGYDYGLMQKMSEIYKYSQMTPSMMASSMNSASSGGGGMGPMSSNSLRYEPPWQRQQQQQQQMRLQQLMQQQQQNQMGAKLYAGGLGSRDPVAMALQQQRAREIMMGGGAGRPRGRPPLQPRAPPAPNAAAPAADAPAQDVVNLDSD